MYCLFLACLMFLVTNLAVLIMNFLMDCVFVLLCFETLLNRDAVMKVNRKVENIVSNFYNSLPTNPFIVFSLAFPLDANSLYNNNYICVIKYLPFPMFTYLLYIFLILFFPHFKSY